MHIDTCSCNNPPPPPRSPTPVHVLPRYENLQSHISAYYCRCLVCKFIEARPTCENMRQVRNKTRRPYFQHINSQKTLSVLNTGNFHSCRYTEKHDWSGRGLHNAFRCNTCPCRHMRCVRRHCTLQMSRHNCCNIRTPLD